MSRAGRWLWNQSPVVRAGFVGVILVATVVTGYTTWATVRADARFRAALSHEDRRDFAAARVAFDRCLADDPDSGQLLFHAARVARRAGDLAAANRLLKSAKRQNWSDEAIDWERTLLRAQSTDFELLEPKLRVALHTAPDHAETELVREVLLPGYMSRLQWPSAYELLQDWIDRNPDELRLRLWMYEVARRMLNSQEAITAAQNAVRIAPESGDARAKCAEILIENHHAAEAKVHYGWLLERNPEDAEARFGTAKCLHELGDLDGAARELSALLQRDPDRPAYLIERGKIDLQAGRPAVARDSFRKAVERDRSNPELLYNYALSLDQSGDKAGAKVWYDRHKKAEADLAELQDVTARFAGEPNNPALPRRAGELLIQNGHEREGVRWLRRALELDPTHSETRKMLEKYQQLDRSGGLP